jgi:hypothetical protein
MSFADNHSIKNPHQQAGTKTRRVMALFFICILSVIFGSLFATNGWSQIIHEESRTGSSSASMTVTTSASLTGVNGHLYLAAISMRKRVSVISVSGLGLTWTLVKSKCAGRNTTGIEVWMAQGIAQSGNGTVTATFASTPITAVIAVSRYSGVAASNPIGNVIAGNSNGVNASGACLGGVDGSSYSFTLNTSVNNAVVYGAVAMRGRKHAPGAGYTERAEIQQVNGTFISGVAVQDKNVASIVASTVDGSFSNTVDWTLVALEIKPKSLGPFTLTIKKSGYGNVTLNPPGGVYNSGTVVTLTATPEADFRFNYWNGALYGFKNPATLKIDGNKTVEAVFTLRPEEIIHEETETGSASNSATLATTASLTGANGHLYLTAISTQPRVSVAAVSGLGLAWKLVKSKCAGRNTTGVEVWMAQGTPSDSGKVTAAFSNAPSASVIAVSRYSGVASSFPIGNGITANSNGLYGNSSCFGGMDGNTYSIKFSPYGNNSLIYTAVAIKDQIHAPGSDYVERAEVHQSNDAHSGLATADKTIMTAGKVTIDGTFSGAVDWALAALEIKPKIIIPPGYYTLTIKFGGVCGHEVYLNPGGGLYRHGEVVTLTAVPLLGCLFSHWDGDLTGNANPATIIMNGNKTVTGVSFPIVRFESVETAPESTLLKRGELEDTKILTATPSAYRLQQNYPNPFGPPPFNAQSVIEYDLPQETALRLVIYDLTGQVVRRLADGLQPAGRHRVIWNGQNDAGAPVASGVYFYQLEIGAQKLTRKMVLQR